MEDKEEPEFLDRINNPEKYPYIKNKDGSVSTHRMAAEIDDKTGNWIVFPMIQFDGESLKQFETNQDAMDEAIATGNFLPPPIRFSGDASPKLIAFFASLPTFILAAALSTHIDFSKSIFITS